MPTVNFSVPEAVKREFDETFAGENKSAVIRELMRLAVEQRRQQQRRAAAIDALLKLRQKGPRVPASRVARARRQGRS